MLALAALVPLEALAADDEVTVYKRAVEKSFAAWLEALWPDARSGRRLAQDLRGQSQGAEARLVACRKSCLPDPAYPEGPALPGALKPKPRHQAEFDIPELYFSKSALNSLAATGRGKYKQLGADARGDAADNMACRRASSSPSGDGRPASARRRCRYDALSAIATQGFMGRRPEVFRQEVIAALKILEEGHATRAEMRSSWAGAMGYTQFLPSDFDKYAVDFDGDGRRDIWNSVPDALASAGNSLHSQGWDGSADLGL